MAIEMGENREKQEESTTFFCNFSPFLQLLFHKTKSKSREHFFSGAFNSTERRLGEEGTHENIFKFISCFFFRLSSTVFSSPARCLLMRHGEEDGKIESQETIGELQAGREVAGTTSQTRTQKNSFIFFLLLLQPRSE